MRLRFGFLLASALAAGCGGSTSSHVPDDERIPATPLPTEQTGAAARGPTGLVTVLSIDGHQLSMPAFYEDAARFREAATSPCVLGRMSGGRSEEVSAGTLTFELPFRDGSDTYDVRWDPKEKSYEPMMFERPLEPGGTIRVSAEGATAPAFSADLKTAANVAFHVPDTIELDANAPEDLTIEWSAEGDNDEVFLDLRIGATYVTCWFDSTAGSGTVPAALVADLAKDPAGATCEKPDCMLILASKRTKNVDVGEWTMILSHGFAVVREVRVAL